MKPTAAAAPAQETQFAFREVRTAQEMRDVLSLRYRVYMEVLGVSALPSLDHTSRLDLDLFDLTSRHFALLARTRDQERVVGTLRIAGPHPGPMAMALKEIAALHPQLRSHLSGDRDVPLPMLTYLEQSHLIRAEYDRRVASGEEIAEPGRLTIAPELRVAAARMGLRLSHFLVCCAEASAWYLLGLDRVFMDCDVTLEPFYRRFGFFSVQGIPSAFHDQLGIRFTVLQATLDSLSAAFRPEVERLAGQLRDREEAVFAPAGTVAEEATGARRRAVTLVPSPAVTVASAA